MLWRVRNSCGRPMNASFIRAVPQSWRSRLVALAGRMRLNTLLFAGFSRYVKRHTCSKLAMAANPLSRRYRAEECRRIAESLHGAETQLKLLRIAADYDWMAMRAAAFELQQADELGRSFAKSKTKLI